MEILKQFTMATQLNSNTEVKFGLGLERNNKTEKKIEVENMDYIEEPWDLIDRKSVV